MKRTYSFTSQKFLQLPPSGRHKKCAELMRAAIEADPVDRIELLKSYLLWCSWMEFEPLHHFALEQLADRYHAHLILSGTQLKEDRLLQAASKDRSEPLHPPLEVTIYLEGIRTAHNIGSIIRTCECYGLARVALSPQMASTTSLQVKRAAMGADQWISILEEVELEDCPRPWIALETNTESTPLDHFTFPSSFTLILGNEEHGCRSSTLDDCNQCLHIPMHGRKNSLNVAAAFACAAYEIRRQWRATN